MAYRIFVDGQEGTTGLQIHALLARRPDLEVLTIDPAQRKERAARARLLNAADVVFLCLPDDAAREAVSLVTNPDTCIIDASTAHRTAPGWTYGLPELARGQRAALRTAKRIANPGCHATAFILLLRPLIDAGLLPAAAYITATSLTGYSGGGRRMIAQYAAAAEAELSAPRPYALSLAHKHLPEMTAHTGLVHRPLFLPVVSNFYKGLAVSVPLHLAQLTPGADGAAVLRALAAHYAGERYIQVRPIGAATGFQDGFLDVQACNDTNRCDLFVFANASQLLLVARLDNLGKGASGAAVQSMNLHLGLDEAMGLDRVAG
jgi:N-acetyl-gamma-glutamyl-phosphate reductase